MSRPLSDYTKGELRKEVERLEELITGLRGLDIQNENIIATLRAECSRLQQALRRAEGERDAALQLMADNVAEASRQVQASDKLYRAISASLTAANERIAELENELDAVLSDWNNVVRASGSPTNGGVAGHLAAIQSRLARSEEVRKDLAFRLGSALPMAKGYAAAHVVGSNQQMCMEAEQSLAASDALDQTTP